MWRLSSALEHIAVGIDERRARRPKRPFAPRLGPTDVLLGEGSPIDALIPSTEPVVLSRGDRDRHVYVLGATGSGKTNLLLRLIQSDISSGRTVVVLDLRGDLIDRVLTRIASGSDYSVADRLCLVDFREPSHIVGINPLTTPGDVHTTVLHLVGVIRGQAESWGVQLEETLRNALLVLAEARLSLTELEPLLTDPRFRDAVLSRAQDASAIGFFARFGSLSPERQLSWALPVLNKVTGLLSTPRIRLAFGSSKCLDWSKLLDDSSGRIILVGLAVDRFHSTANLVGALLISSLQAAIMARVSTPEALRNPVSLYVDEFETMASDAFSSIVAEGRRFKLALTLSHQNLAQVSPELRAVLRNNVHTQFYFQTGVLDAADLAGEVVCGLTRQAVQSRLLSLKVGQACLIRRSESALVVQTQLETDSKATDMQLSFLRKASNQAFAQSEKSVRAAMELRRLHGMSSLGELQEVRHGQKPHLS